MYQILQKCDIHWHDGGPSIAMMYHLRRVSDLLCNWNSCLLCYMKDVVLHCSIFFKWNKLVRVRLNIIQVSKATPRKWINRTTHHTKHITIKNRLVRERLWGRQPLVCSLRVWLSPRNDTALWFTCSLRWCGRRNPHTLVLFRTVPVHQLPPHQHQGNVHSDKTRVKSIPDLACYSQNFRSFETTGCQILRDYIMSLAQTSNCSSVLIYVLWRGLRTFAGSKSPKPGQLHSISEIT